MFGSKDSRKEEIKRGNRGFFRKRKREKRKGQKVQMIRNGIVEKCCFFLP